MYVLWLCVHLSEQLVLVGGVNWFDYLVMVVDYLGGVWV